jgi:hypothetical protein
MRTRTLVGIAAAGLFLGLGACARQNPVAPSATGSSTLAPSALTSSANVNGTMDYREEQIVFSGQTPNGIWTNSGTSDVADVGFWLWCEHGGPTGNPQHTKNGYAGECAGSLNIGDLSRGVSGDVHMDADKDQHIMEVSSKDGALVCTLWDNDPVADEGGLDADVPHTQGPTNIVYVSCDNPSGVSGHLDGAVVRTTDETPTITAP